MTNFIASTLTPVQVCFKTLRSLQRRGGGAIFPAMSDFFQTGAIATLHRLGQQRVERLEEQLNNIEGIRTLSSQSREQVSTITLEFDLSRDIDQCAQDVRDRVSRVRGRLPESIDEPIVAKQDADAQPIIWIGVNSDVYTALELTLLAEKQMKNRLQTVRGVSGVIIGGV